MAPSSIMIEEVFPGVWLVEARDEGGGWKELSWLVDHSGGNILVDPPRFGPASARAVDGLGGARFIFLTHRGSVGDACKFKERYAARLVVHRADAAAVAGCSVDEAFEGDHTLVQGVRLLHAGGHTAGSSLMYVMRERGYLFAGDLLAIDGGRGPVALRLRKGGEAEGIRRTLLHVRELRFGAVLPFHSRHERANFVAGSSSAVVDALLQHGVFSPA